MVPLVARCGERERHFPYGLVRQLFEPALRRVPASVAGELLSGAARLAAPVVAGHDDQLPPDGASADTAFALAHGLHWLTVNFSMRAPTLIVVDDVQWGDAPSLRFLHYLVNRLEGVAAALLVSSRSDDQGVDPDFAAQLAAEPPVHRLTPAPLSGRAVAQLLGNGLAQPPDEAFTAACCAATGGSPFLVHELIDALAADGVEPTAEQAAGVQTLGPHTIARATLVRLAGAPAGCVPLARAIAVLAGEARLSQAARLAGLQESAALRALDVLVETRVVHAGQPLEFVHPIVRAAIYDELAPGERSNLHRLAARLLTAEGAELDAVASQLLASEPTGSQEVVAQLRQAASEAIARGAPENAVAYLSRALREGFERPLRAAVSFDLARAARFAGQPSIMVEQFKEAQRLAEDPVLRNSAALELATALAFKGEWEAPISLVQAALEDLGDRGPELAVRLECFRAATAATDPRLVREFDRRLPVLHDLVDSRCASACSLALVLAALGAWRGRDVREVVTLVDRGWDEGRHLGAGVDRWAQWQGLAALVISEELARANELADALLSDARARGSLFAFLLETGYRGWIEARCGQLGVAEDGLRAALQGVREHRLLFELPPLLWFATDVILERPEAGDLAALAENVELGPLASVHSGAMLLDVRGRVRHAAGDIEAGIEDLRRAGEIWQALGFRNPNATSWRSTVALMIGGDERAQARRLVSEELDDARRVGHPRAVGVALRALGLLEGGEDGRRRLEQSVATLEHTPARLEHARALVELGAALRRTGERSAAREPLRTGLDIGAAGGATRLAERARTELAASGARPRRTRATGREALTPSELRVARLAAAGRTNNEIAQALFVTPKTIDTHLSHSYQKLGISSRRALGAALTDRATADGPAADATAPLLPDPR